SLGEARDVEQVRLSTNDELLVFDDAAVAGPGGQKFYRVAPPRGEYRWILGQYAIPVDESLRRQHDRDPFATPSQAKRTTTDASSAQVNAAGPSGPTDADAAAAGFAPKPMAKTPMGTPSATPEAPVAATPDAERFRAERQRLMELDGGLRTMLEQDVSTWD